MHGEGGRSRSSLERPVLSLSSVTRPLHKDNCPHNLVRGQAGTVVEGLAEGIFEVEFSDDEGRTYGLLALPAETLMVLRHDLLRAS